MAEMLHTKVGCQHLSSESVVALLWWLLSFREESEQLWMITFSLVENSADRCLRDVVLCLRKLTSALPKQDLSELTTSPCTSSHRNTSSRCCMCSSLVLLAMRISRPLRTQSMNCWKVWEPFRKKFRHREKFERDERVEFAVLGMSSGVTGIWWYARTRSIVEKTVIPRRDETQSCTAAQITKITYEYRLGWNRPFPKL